MTALAAPRVAEGRSAAPMTLATPHCDATIFEAMPNCSHANIPHLAHRPPPRGSRLSLIRRRSQPAGVSRRLRARIMRRQRSRPPIARKRLRVRAPASRPNGVCEVHATWSQAPPQLPPIVGKRGLPQCGGRGGQTAISSTRRCHNHGASRWRNNATVHRCKGHPRTWAAYRNEAAPTASLTAIIRAPGPRTAKRRPPRRRSIVGAATRPLRRW